MAGLQSLQRQPYEKRWHLRHRHTCKISTSPRCRQQWDDGVSGGYISCAEDSANGNNSKRCSLLHASIPTMRPARAVWQGKLFLSVNSEDPAKSLQVDLKTVSRREPYRDACKTPGLITVSPNVGKEWVRPLWETPLTEVSDNMAEQLAVMYQASQQHRQQW